MIDANGQALGFRKGEQVTGFVRRSAHRLFEKHADTCLQRDLRHLVMEIRRYEHVHDIEALLSQHRLQRRVSGDAPASGERFNRCRIDVADRHKVDAVRGLDGASVEIRDITRANNCGTDGTSNREISCVQEQFLWLPRSCEDDDGLCAVSLEARPRSQRIF